MKKVEFSIQAPVTAEYDVVVCGGGPAGFIAAIAAARHGASVALIEQYGFLGGMATAGLVCPISRYNFHGRRVIGGIPWEFVERLKEVGGAFEETPSGNVNFDPEKYKLVAQRMVLEAGVKLYFYSYLAGCLCENGQLSHVILHTKKGAQAIGAKYFIDCTGDADLARMAGVHLQPVSEQLQPNSHCFLIGGVDTVNMPLAHHNQDGRNSHDLELRKLLHDLAENEEVPSFGGPWYCSIVQEGYLAVNMTRTAADMIDPEEATLAACRLREDVHKMMSLLRKYAPAFRNAFLVYTAPAVGVRETRRILGAHTLTGEEYLNAVDFPDSVSRGCHPVDIHHASDRGQRCQFLKKAAFVPYRTLYSPDFVNLLVAGRCFSADEVASASVRVQASVMGLGQAAGVSAAMCVKDGCSVAEVDVKALRAELVSMGAVLD